MTPSNNSQTLDAEHMRRWRQLTEPKPVSVPNVQLAIADHMTKTLARACDNIDGFAVYESAARSVRDQLVGGWERTQAHHTQLDAKVRALDAAD